MRSLLVVSTAMLALLLMQPAFAQDSGTKTDQQGQMIAPITPGNTEAQPGQPAAPHGLAEDQQHQATRAEDAAAGEKAVQQPAPASSQ